MFTDLWAKRNHICANIKVLGGYVFAEVGTKNDGIQRIVKGYVYLGGYVLNYLLKVTGGMLFTKGMFIWHNIVRFYDRVKRALVLLQICLQ